MFKSIKTPQDYFAATSAFYNSLPKTSADVKAIFEKTQKVFQTELANTQDVIKTYQKATTGDATVKEIAVANQKAAELAKSITFASIVSVPGAFFVLPAIIDKAKELKLDIVPKSVSDHFGV